MQRVHISIHVEIRLATLRTQIMDQLICTDHVSLNCALNCEKLLMNVRSRE